MDGYVYWNECIFLKLRMSLSATTVDAHINLDLDNSEPILQHYVYYCDVSRAFWGSKSPAMPLFCSTVVQTYIKETSKFRDSGSLWEELQWLLNSLHKEPVTRKLGPCHDVIITSYRSDEVMTWNASTGKSPAQKCPLLTHWGLVTPYASENWVNIGSGNDLLPDGTKPLLEPMLIYHQ